MTQHIDKADRVQGMLGAAERWTKVIPRAVVSGSSAQAENVLTDAIHDIGCLWAFAVATSRQLSEAQAALAAAEERGRMEERERCVAVFDRLLRQLVELDRFSRSYALRLTSLAKADCAAITKEPTP